MKFNRLVLVVENENKKLFDKKVVILLNVSSGAILKDDSDLRSHFKWLVYVRTQSLQSAQVD